MRPIRSPEDHGKVLEEIAALIDAAPGTPESDRLELLAVLAADYERRAVPPEPDPADVIALAMRAKGRSQRELSNVLGSRARASEVLARRRSLSEAMIESVAGAWNIPRNLLIGRRRIDRRKSRVGRAVSSACMLLLAAGAALLGAFAWHGRNLPDTDALVAEAKAGSGGELPPHVIQAFIAAEDRRFLDHDGYDPLAIVRAGTHSAFGGQLQGGAGITQQLVKVALLQDEPPSVRRKVREVLLARVLEGSLSKDQILRTYLRHVYFGRGAYGLSAAAKVHFGRPVGELTVAQAAQLAGVLDAPAEHARSPEGSTQERDEVLARMARAGFLTPDLRRTAARERM